MNPCQNGCENPENCKCKQVEEGAVVVAEQGMFGDLAAEFGVADPTKVQIG